MRPDIKFLAGYRLRYMGHAPPISNAANWSHLRTSNGFWPNSWVFAGFCFCASPPRSTRCLRLCALRGSTRRLRLGVTRAACALVHTFVKTSIIHAAPRFASPKAGVTCAAGVLVRTFVKTLIIHAALCFASPKVGVTRAAGVLVHTFVKTLIIHAAPRFASPKVWVAHAACMWAHTF